MKPMKPMTPKQKEMYNAITAAVTAKGYAYIEYGSSKYWSERVLDALWKKGVIRVTESGNGWARVVLR